MIEHEVWIPEIVLYKYVLLSILVVCSFL